MSNIQYMYTAEEELLLDLEETVDEVVEGFRQLHIKQILKRCAIIGGVLIIGGIVTGLLISYYDKLSEKDEMTNLIIGEVEDSWDEVEDLNDEITMLEIGE